MASETEARLQREELDTLRSEMVSQQAAVQRLEIALKEAQASTTAAQLAQRCAIKPVLLFSKLNRIFLGYFDPDNIFFYYKNKYFSG